jgi:hypothetical protein
MTGLQAIETKYAGRLFRSRLEARWAVFFDALSVDWRYEPQGFDLSGVYYLPDFYLPRQATWIECKGDLDGERYFALDKARRLARRSGRRVLITSGDIPYPYPTIETHPESMLAVFPNGDEDFPYWWCTCPLCGAVGIEYAGRAERIGCGCLAQQEGCPAWPTAELPRLQAAYEAALSARFEHGQGW